MTPAGREDLPYRCGVGIMLVNGEGLVWIGRRRQMAAAEAPAHLWQMPQGGIDSGEAPRDAAFRELAEETGTAEAEVIGETRDWLGYDLPQEVLGVALHGRYRGQRLKWFAMRFLGSDDAFNIDVPVGGHEPEFDAWRWAALEELPALVVPFKRPVYEAVIAELGPLTAGPRFARIR